MPRLANIETLQGDREPREDPLEEREEKLLGRPRIRGALENHELTRPEAGGDLLRRGNRCPDVRQLRRERGARSSRRRTGSTVPPPRAWIMILRS